VALRLLAPRKINDDTPHDLGSVGIEMPPVLKLRTVNRHQIEIAFEDQALRVEQRIRLMYAQVRARDFAKLGIQHSIGKLRRITVSRVRRSQQLGQRFLADFGGRLLDQAKSPRGNRETPVRVGAGTTQSLTNHLPTNARFSPHQCTLHPIFGRG